MSLFRIIFCTAAPMLLGTEHLATMTDCLMRKTSTKTNKKSSLSGVIPSRARAKSLLFLPTCTPISRPNSPFGVTGKCPTPLMLIPTNSKLLPSTENKFNGDSYSKSIIQLPVRVSSCHNLRLELVLRVNQDATCRCQF